MLRTPIVLASASPRRRELLTSIGLTFTVDPADVDEETLSDLDPLQQAVALAELKAEYVARRHGEALVIGADTIVTIDGMALGKPQDDEDARRMLRMLSGRTHEVITGVAVVDAATNRAASEAERTLVTFRTLSEDEIARYVASGEPMDKAGAYAIQGLGALLVSRIVGCYPNVVGLPLVTLARLLQPFGVVVL